MTAKRIKRLRKKVSEMEVYSIRETCGLFGDFFGDNRLSLILSDNKVKALSSEHAIKRYMSKYYRKYKMRNRHAREYYEETTAMGSNNG